ncbi:hypothetical protein GCM10010255_58800 [Streptomyces coeruleofuscus]|uniref:Uncharacterized protein n=1 Tax=Streptomyces coeruleofuscus TaxID=66879 RepID=A0ABP5VYK6_9ACTN
MPGGTNSAGAAPHLPAARVQAGHRAPDATDARSAAREGITSCPAPRTALRARLVRHPRTPFTFGMKAQAPYWPPF